jgi:hypothetical protein
MSKIVQAINVMIVNSDRITDVTPSTTTDIIFFRYDNKYIWGIREDVNEEGELIYYLTYFPDNTMISHLVSLPNYELKEIKQLVYFSAEFNSREATQSFAELYTIINEKKFGVDSVLEDIIKSGDVPF